MGEGKAPSFATGICLLKPEACSCGGAKTAPTPSNLSIALISALSNTSLATFSTPRELRKQRRRKFQPAMTITVSATIGSQVAVALLSALSVCCGARIWQFGGGGLEEAMHVSHRCSAFR